MVTRAYVPEAGDIVWLEFDPQAGHEQAGHRPVLVLSPAAYNAKKGLMVCCPTRSNHSTGAFAKPKRKAQCLKRCFRMYAP
jgi:mRNA-degrading endonuclease toxin of MazEF toxin-antitoxin module